MFNKIIKKAFSLLFGYPFYIFSFLIPRNEKKIVVGSHIPFNDNSKYFFLSAQKYLPEYTLIWITNDATIVKTLKLLHLNVHKKISFKGIYHSLTAKFYLYSFHLIDINFWTSGGSIKFNLWHGIPLKNIAFATKTGPSSKLYNENSLFSRIVRPHIFVRPNYMVTTSKTMSVYFSKAFRIKEEQCLSFGMPRCDILFWKKKEIINFIKKYESIELFELILSFSIYKRVIIYMPTWREKADFLVEAKFDFEKLNKLMKKTNQLFIFKLHPFTKLKNMKLDDINSYSNLLIMDSNMDFYPILPFTDCLITDYSSIYYDYLLLNKPVHLYVYDYEEYKLKSRDLAFDFNRAMPAKRLKNFKDVLDICERVDESITSEQIKIRSKYFGSSNDQSCKKLSEFIRGLNK